ncbi:MAG TPA: cytochrome ubiquinol oxidase subunit I, partial [Anaerolineales bacterium]|nr:cytochrome ubiquinol oxidase subunit I [Anaerolineales bacterium]
PMKIAAAEALWETEDPASFSVLTIGDLSQTKEVFSIRIPKVLSLLSYNQLWGEVRGIYDLQAEYVQKYGPGNYTPPVAVIYWSFRIMVGAGMLMIGLSIYALFISRGDRFAVKPKILSLFTFAIALPYLANSFGWIMTEIGRYPWVVYGLMKIEDGVSPIVGPGKALASLLGFTVLYGALMGATIYLLSKYARAGIQVEPASSMPDDALPSLVGAQR